MNFGSAIKAIKAGKKASREGWNGKSQYIELAACISYRNASGEIVNVNHDAIGNNAIAFVGTSGIQLGWLLRPICLPRTGGLWINKEANIYV